MNVVEFFTGWYDWYFLIGAVVFGMAAVLLVYEDGETIDNPKKALQAVASLILFMLFWPVIIMAAFFCDKSKRDARLNK